MKKLLALLLAMMMIFSVATLLAGCDDDSSKKNASSKEDKDDEEEKKGDDKPTDPSEPSTPSEPSEPESTGDGLLPILSPNFKEEDHPSLAIVGVLNNGTENIEVQYGYEILSDTEVLVYMTNPDGEWMYRAKATDAGVEYNRYLIVDGQWQEDETVSHIFKDTEFAQIQSYFRPFTGLDYGLKYKQIGTESHDLGTLNVFEIYDGEELRGTVKVHSTFGLLVEVKDTTGVVACSLNMITTELDLEDFLENGYPGSEPPESDVKPGDGDDFESDIDVSDPMTPGDGGVIGGDDFDINFG